MMGLIYQYIPLRERCPLRMNGLSTWENMNVIPLCSYDSFIRMDRLEAHQVNLDFHSKDIDCIDEDGNSRIVRGIAKGISLRHILSFLV
jgi:hypothetical protein